VLDGHAIPLPNDTDAGLGDVDPRDHLRFVANQDAVIAALKRGECDRILPAARGFLDGFAESCLEAGVLECSEALPDPRARRSIPIFFFCNTLVYRSLFHLKRLAPIADVLFRSPYILRQLGFNGRQIGKDSTKHRFLFPKANWRSMLAPISHSYSTRNDL
jgi:hypothetical protein